MKKPLLYLLLCLCLLALPALAETADSIPLTLTTPDGLTVTHVLNQPDALPSDAELLVQHYCAMGEYEKAFALNEQLAALGDTAAVYRLGCQYLSGLGTTKDMLSALECFTTAKAAGSTDAALALILARLNGWGMPQDTLGATAELNALGFHDALARLYLHGAYDVPAHEATAMHWFEQAWGHLKESNHILYDKLLFSFITSSPTCLTDPLPVQLADWDNPALQAWAGLSLGQFWQEGRGGVVDMHAAAYWYEFTTTLADDPETSWAHAKLADLYLSGALGEVDAGKAMAHFQQDLYDGGYGAYRVGLMYWDGVTGADGTVHLAPDTQTALHWLTQAAEASNISACVLLGNAYRTGDRVSADPVKAAHFYALGLMNTAAADCYDPLLTMYQQGLLYDRAVMDEIYHGLRYWHGTDLQLAILLAEHWLNGVTAEDGTVLVQQDRKAAFELMDYFHEYHAVLHDTPEVYFLNWLGWFYSGNAPEAVGRDYAKALACYTESANVGNGYAMAMVGVFYQNGRGIPVDHMTARAWYKKAIEAGYTGAQGYLDALNAAYPEYPVDLPVTIVTSQGLTLTHTVNRTDEQPFTDAELLAAGCGIEGLWGLALEINQQLAEMGDVDAMYRLGCHYAAGLGVQPDDALAVEWLRKAADAGCEDAVYTLACMYLNGWGVMQDVPKAAGMLESLGAYGPEELPFLLATLYKTGHGTLAADAAKAQAFLDEAAADCRAVIRQYEALGQTSAALDAAKRTHASLLAAYEASTAPDARLTTRPQPMMSRWLADPGTICVGVAEFWTAGRGSTADYAEAVRWYENALRIDPMHTAVCHPLAEMLRDSRAGYCDAQRAIVLFCEVGAYDEVAAMFDTGVTGPDGQVCLAPNAIIAEAFHTWAADPGHPEAGARLGDLFRDGSIVTANPDIAAAFYWRTTGSQHCTDQLTALIGAGAVTDEYLLYEIVTNMTAAETDMSALAAALAEGVLNGVLAPDGVLGQADALRVTREMLQSAADAGKVDAATAGALLERMGQPME